MILQLSLLVLLIEPIADERLKPQPILINTNEYVELDPVDLRSRLQPNLRTYIFLRRVMMQ